MECKYCHTDLAEESLYCHICGKKQVTNPKQRRHRAQSQGTITKLSGKRSNPYWARLPADYSTGVPVRKSLGCYPTYRAASKAVSQALHTQKSGVLYTTADSVTIQQLYDRFTNSHYFTSLSKSAQSCHKSAWNHLSCISPVLVTELCKDTFQVPVDNMQIKGLKTETMAKVRNLASLLCKEAIGMGLITVNYGQLVQLPKNDTTPAKPFASDDLKRIWIAADSKNEDAQTVLLMIYTGMRPNELLHLDVAKHLHINKDYWYIQTGSKSAAGQNRLIPVPEILHDIITTMIGDRSTGPLIQTKKGGYYRLDNWRSRHFVPLMKSLGLTGYTPYSCRHTYADLQKRRNIDPEIMMIIMGHEDYSTTVERYHTTTVEDIARICRAVAGITRPE